MFICCSLGASFDKAECTQWVGEIYLAATAPTTSSAIGRSELLRAWKDCLPEAWRGEVALSKLPVTRPFPPMGCGAIADFDYRMAATTVLTLRLYALLNPRNGSHPIKLPLHQPQPRRLRIPEIGTNCSKVAVDCKKKKNLTHLLRKMPWHLIYDARISRSTIISATQTRLDPTLPGKESVKKSRANKETNLEMMLQRMND